MYSYNAKLDQTIIKINIYTLPRRNLINGNHLTFFEQR